MLSADTTHVIWDWNGTLLDDGHLVIDIMNGMLREHALDSLDRDRYRTLFDFPVEGYYKALGFTDRHGDFANLAMRFIDEYEARVRECDLHRGAEDALAGVARTGVAQSILTAAHQDSVVSLLDHHGVRHHIGEVVGLDNHFAGGKIERGLAWLESHHIDARSTVLIGDTVHDFEVAQSLGVSCVLIADGHNSEDRLRACACPVVPSLRALLASDSVTKNVTSRS